MASKSKASRDSAKELAQKLFSAEEKKGINNHLIARYISHASQEYANFKLPQTQPDCSSNNSKKIAYLIVAHYLKIHNMNVSISLADACLIFNSSITRILLMSTELFDRLSMNNKKQQHLNKQFR